MLSGRSSKSTSLQSLANLFGNNQDGEDVPPPRHIEVNVIETADNQPEDPDDLQYSGLSSDNALNPTMQYNYTNNHPLGKIFIGLLKDNIQLADKTKLRSMETSVQDLCTNFYNAMKLERNRTNNRINQSIAEIETNIINKELNSHMLNQSVEAPRNFSPVPTLLTPRQRAECMKLFPTGSQKFSGQSKDKDMSIIEFLTMVKTAQAQCNLSEQEFKEMLLASTTGKAHLLLIEWLSNNDDPSAIFHNLLLHFDRRITPEEARQQLNIYKAPKTANLAKVFSHIMLLEGRAITSLPQGPAREAPYNMEIVQTLIRCLPTSSSILVQNTYNQLSARLGRAAKADELSRALHTVRHAIDIDIKNNGVDQTRKMGGQKPFAKYTPRANRVTSYSVTTQPSQNKTNYRQNMSRPRTMPVSRPQNGNFSRIGNFSGRTQAMGQGASNGATPKRNFNNYRNYNGPNKFNRFSQNKDNLNYCSLCGQRNHRAKDGCPNMKSDSGKQIDVFPTHTTCSLCPAKIMPRLNHPSIFCPFRKGGPLCDKA